ncbi:unnamed protein product [Prunus brigantina]
MPLPFEQFQGKGVLDFSSSISDSQPPQNQHLHHHHHNQQQKKPKPSHILFNTVAFSRWRRSQRQWWWRSPKSPNSPLYRSRNRRSFDEAPLASKREWDEHPQEGICKGVLVA